MVRYLFIIGALICLYMSPVSAGNIKIFDDNSFPTIIAQRENQPFILVIWSIDCAPCMKELELLSSMRTQHPQLDIVLVSIDGQDSLNEVRSVLQSFAMDQADNWLFAVGNSQRLRYHIDEQWFGELPRSYLYADAMTRMAHSGALMRAQLDRWLQVIDGKNKARM